MGNMQTPSGTASGATNANGLNGLSSGSPLGSAKYNADQGDLQTPAMEALLPGVLNLAGGLTYSALVVTVPSGYAWYARQVWQANGTVTGSVPASATTYLWGCSDGLIRPASSLTPPAGFAGPASCLLAIVVSGSTAITSLAQGWTARACSGRVVTDGPLVLDYANNVVDASGAALKIPSGTADPAVPGTGVYIWFRTDTSEIGVSINGTVKHTAALT